MSASQVLPFVDLLVSKVLDQLVASTTSQNSYNDSFSTVLNDDKELAYDRIGTMDSYNETRLGNPRYGFTEVPKAVEMPSDLPAQLSPTAARQRFDDAVDKFSKQFKQDAIDFFTKYFPDDMSDLNTVRSWVNGALNYSYTPDSWGINQAWEQARARALTEAGRANDEALVAWAARGYPLPPGAAAQQRSMIDQDARDKIADVNRTQAVEQSRMILEAERMGLEHQRAAAGLLVQIPEIVARARTEAMRAAAEYIRLQTLGPTLAVQLSTSSAEAEGRMTSALMDYYRTWVSTEELPSRVRMANADRYINQRQAVYGQVMQKGSEFADGMKANALAMAQQASTALNALHAQVGMSGSERMLDNNL